MTRGAQNDIEYVTLKDYEIIVSLLRKLKQQYTEDIPPFNTRYPGTLEAIIGQLKQTVFGKEIYKGVVSKAAIMFYLLTKNHPFVNGNKRVAILALILFLKRNATEVYFNWNDLNDGLYKMAIKTTESPSDEFGKTISYLKRKIRKYIIQI